MSNVRCFVMNSRLRKAVGLFAVIGGVIGVALTGWILLHTGRLPLVGAVVFLYALSFYGLGIWAGVSALQLRGEWRRLNVFFWALQIPLFLSPGFSYAASSGVGAWLYVAKGPTFGGNFYLGSQFQIGAGQIAAGMVAGLNVIALAITILFVASARENKKVPVLIPNESPAPAPDNAES